MDYASLGLHPYGAIPTERQMAHIKMEKKAFIHFGVNLFDGTSFQFALKGVSDGEKIKIRLENIESGSYQIKLKATEPFVTDGNFRVSLEK